MPQSRTPLLTPVEEASLTRGFQGTTLNESADAAASVATPYSFDLNDRFGGTLSTSSDDDWIEIELVAGENYVFSVWGTNGSIDGLNDPELTLYDSSGTLLSYNDDIDPGHQNYFSMIEFTAATSGTYYLEVSSSFGGGGDYILQATTDVLTPEQVATQITEFGWGIETAIHHNESTGDSMTVNIQGLTAAGQQLATWALEAWGEVMGIVFNTTTSSVADIVFDDRSAGAFAGPSAYNPRTGIITQADVNISSQWLTNYGTTYDSYSYLTYLHEIGHALGMTHTGNYNGSASFGTDNFFANDSYQISVMSYFGIDEAGLGSDAIAVTPMIADVYAVWGLYGEPAMVHAGDTIWGANSNVSGTLGTVMGYLFDGDAVDANIYGGGEIALTITDTDGYDVVDLSTVTDVQTIDLREGGVSNIAGGVGNVVISLGTTIEEVIGGTENDVIYGSDDDTVFDIGGGLSNQVFGGAGNDTAIIDGNFADATINQISGTVVTISVGSSGAEYHDVEFYEFQDGVRTRAELFGADPGPLTGTPGTDLLVGTGFADEIDGLAGNDRIEGAGGGDTLYGGLGNDGILGQDGDDHLYGGGGDDNLPGAAGNDRVYGGDGNDRLGGGDGDDILYGGDGKDHHGAGPGQDTVYGGEGNDSIATGTDSDWLYGEAGHDQMAGSYGDDHIFGGIGNDVIGGGAGFDTIYGDDGDDTVGAGYGSDELYGGDGNDILNSGGAADTIFGGNGNDRINAGNGQDVMSGGQGEDTFVFNTPTLDVVDRITDFEAGLDTLRLRSVAGNGTQDKFDNLDISQTGADATIKWLGHTILLETFDSATLTVDDFIFT